MLFILKAVDCSPLFAQSPVSIKDNQNKLQNSSAGNYSPFLDRVAVNKKYDLQSKNVIEPARVNISFNDLAESGISFSCKDSSYKKILSSGTLTYALYCSGETNDGSIILGGFGRDRLVPSPFYGMLVKIDSNGNFIWGKELRANGTSEINVKNIREMSDQSLVICGDFDNNGEPNTMVARLDAAGNLVWVKTFRSNSLQCSTGNPFFINEITEGANGDILVSGFITNCSVQRYALIYKLNSSGALQWSTCFQYPYDDGTGFSMIYENNTIRLLTRSGGAYSGSDNVVHIDFIKIDYSNGSFLSLKSWQVNLTFSSSYWLSFSNQVYSKKLNNGNLCIYGELNGDGALITGVSHHFGVLEFDPNDDFVKGYTINSLQVANANGTSSINVDGTGNCVFSLFVNYTGPSLDLFMGSIGNGNILKLRQRQYANTGMFGLDAWELLSDQSYIFLKQLSDVDNTNERIEFSRLHNSDSSSACLGTDSDFCYVLPIDYIPYVSSITNIFSNVLSETGNSGIIINSQSHYPTDSCFKKTSNCDTLKIHGTSVSCSLSNDFIYTAYKNPLCGSWVNWVIDTSAITTFQTLNDTTLKIHFKNSWQGYLYSFIPTACGMLKDSLFISITNVADSLDLGPDTSLCPSNTITLNAHSGYASYLWQDNSTDSTFTITTPGTYFVKVTDGCGNALSDTITVAAASPIPLDIGMDRTKCNNDTLHINAPAGFLNYNWSPGYNINSTTSQNVVVAPLKDTSYYIMAEKAPGCIAFDTIHITVYSSPAIDLGTDKSFCMGDSMVLDAGAFFNSYQWSTTASTQHITVRMQGNYSVIGTTSQGCSSYDTVKVINVYPLPVVNLNKDPILCKGDPRTLDAGSGFATYLWNTGNTTRTIMVNDTGQYSVTVTDNNGCKKTDTTSITTLLLKPSAFLPPDTSICTYGNLVLKPASSFKQYLWNTNATTSSISITQPGLYWLRVTDNNNCSGSDSVVVAMKDCMTGFYVPSAFTPNHDGKNDIFRPLLFGNIKQYQFTIYDRWGEIVFQTKEPGKGWDGKVTGMQQDTNIFIWICSYQLEGQQLKLEKGTVALIQ